MVQTGCSKLLHTTEVTPIVQRMGVASSLRLEVIPAFEEMLSSSPVFYPHTKSFENAKNDPVVVLHSSGSTGKDLSCPNTVHLGVDSNRNTKANHNDTRHFRSV